MKWRLGCSDVTKAGRMYVRRMAAVAIFYTVTVAQVTRMVNHHPPHGWKTYLLAGLPTVPVVAMLAVIGLYLRDEQDEYKRMQVVRSVLWGIAFVLALTVFSGFVRAYGNVSLLPPFAEFMIFWVVVGVAQAVQKLRDRVPADA